MNLFLATLLGACILIHLVMMFKGHGEYSDTKTEKKNKHKHGGCCH